MPGKHYDLMKYPLAGEAIYILSSKLDKALLHAMQPPHDGG